MAEPETALATRAELLDPRTAIEGEIIYPSLVWEIRLRSGDQILDYALLPVALGSEHLTRTFDGSWIDPVNRLLIQGYRFAQVLQPLPDGLFEGNT